MKKIFIKAWKRLALNSFVSGNFKKAEKYFFKIIEYDPESDKMKYNLGLAQLAQKKYQQAEENFKYVIVQYGENYENLKTLGDFYYIWGKPGLAEKYYLKALNLCQNPKDKNLLLKRKKKCQSKGQFNKVLDAHQNFELGTQLLKKKEYELSLEAFERVVKCDETNFHALNNLGVIYLNEKKDPEKALVFFEQAYQYSDIPALAMNIKKVKQYKAEINNLN
jgi:tetratricopeptide (TPR) repeat protein